MVLRTIGPRITGPWDLGCLGSKVRGPKVRGSKALGLIILEPLLGDSFTRFKTLTALMNTFLQMELIEF